MSKPDVARQQAARQETARKASQPGSGPAVDPALGRAPDEQGPPIGTHDPSSMPRAEDDDRVFAGSPEFNDQPGSGKHLGGPSVRDSRRADDAVPDDESGA